MLHSRNFHQLFSQIHACNLAKHRKTDTKYTDQQKHKKKTKYDLRIL